MINPLPNSEHRYVLRSCLICQLLPRCHVRHEVDSPQVWCDKAKYGCIRFCCNNQQIMNEKPKSKKRDYKQQQVRDEAEG